MLIVITPYFILLVLKQVNVVVIVIILMIPTQKICVPDVVKDLHVNIFNLMSRTKKQKIQNDMERVNVNVDQMQLFVMINNIGIMINANVNVKY